MYQADPCSRRVLLLIERSGAYEQGILQGIAAYARQRGNWRFTNQRERAISARSLQRLAFDGIVAHNLLEDKQIEECSIPAVVLTRTAGRMPLPCITCDDELIASLAAEHLMEAGLESFGYVGLPGKYRSDLRLKAFTRRLKKRWQNIQVSACEDLRYELSTQKSIERLTAWIRLLPKPAGLFCFNDNVAEDVCEAVLLAGMRIPDDVALIGVDNDESIADFTHAPLSSIDPDAERIGYEAAAMLDQLMDHASAQPGPVPRPRLIPPITAVGRASTDVRHQQDPVVAAAMSYMRHAARGGAVRVEDLAQASGVSRATLFRRFRDVMAMTPQQQIDRYRLSHVLTHLRQTDLSISHIAIKCGFCDPSALSVFVRRMTGQPPRQFRVPYR